MYIPQARYTDEHDRSLVVLLKKQEGALDELFEGVVSPRVAVQPVCGSYGVRLMVQPKPTRLSLQWLQCVAAPLIDGKPPTYPFLLAPVAVELGGVLEVEKDPFVLLIGTHLCHLEIALEKQVLKKDETPVLHMLRLACVMDVLSLDFPD